MSEQRDQRQARDPRSMTIDELARLYNADVVQDPEELVADIWESDEELQAFLTDLRASRNASLA